MRQRRVTGIEERLAPYAELILKSQVAGPEVPLRFARESVRQICGDPSAAGGGEPQEPSPSGSEESSAAGYKTQGTSPLSARHTRWYQRLSPRYLLPEGFERVYAEFGCGRGLFINTMAAADPGGLYIGIEGCKTIVIRGLAKTKEASLTNVRYIDEFVNDAGAAFGENSLAGIFLNFSDPWPKDRHADRRLTAPKKAEAYFRVLAPGGFASVKTDGRAFFEYSLDSFEKAGFGIAGSGCEIAREVCHKDTAARAAETPTEYELKFREEGKPIYQFTAMKLIL